MPAPRRLDTQQNSQLLPIIGSCMEHTQKSLEGLMEVPVRFSETEGFLIDLDDNDILDRGRFVYVVFQVAGDVESRIAFLCPVSFAATLAALVLKLDEDETTRRRELAELTEDATDAFKQVGDLLGGGLDAAFRESCVHSLHVCFESMGKTDEWHPEEIFDDSVLLDFTTVGKAGAYPTEKIHLVMTQRYITRVTGLDVTTADRAEAGFRLPAPEETRLLTLVAIALDTQQQKIAKTLADAATLNFHVSDDVRDLLIALVNSECMGLILGDASLTLGNKAVQTNIAVLKRLRAHPKGKVLPVTCLIHYPLRDEVVRFAQLGVRDILGMPADDSILERRLHTFVGAAIDDRVKGA